MQIDYSKLRATTQSAVVTHIDRFIFPFGY
jgi:hypothetical protein